MHIKKQLILAFSILIFSHFDIVNLMSSFSGFRYESKFCDLCGKYVKLIVQHKQVVHGIGMEEVEGGAHPCLQCDKAFKYKSSLDK